MVKSTNQTQVTQKREERPVGCCLPRRLPLSLSAPSAVSFGASKEPRKGQRKERQIAGAASFGAYKEAVRGSTTGQ